MKNIFTIITVLMLLFASYAEGKCQTVIAYDDYDTITAFEECYIDVLQNDIVNDSDVKIGVISVSSGRAYCINTDRDSLIYYPRQKFINHLYSKDTIVYCLYKGDYPFGTNDTLSIAKVYLEIDTDIFMGKGYTLDINNYKISVPSYWPLLGNMFAEMGYGSLIEVPKGSELTTIWGAGPWIGGQTDFYREIGEDFRIGCSDSRYQPSTITWRNGPICLSSLDYDSDDYKDEWDKVWGITKSEVLDHIENYDDPDYMIPWAIEKWPANGNTDLGQAKILAPFQDIDGDSIYEPFDGEFPIFFGDQAIYAIFNDAPGYLPAGIPIDKLGTLEIHCMLFVFEESDNEFFNNVFFARYQIYNRPTDYNYVVDIDSAYIGMWTDIDIGYAYDDYSGCDVSQGSYFGYNADSLDGDSSHNYYYGTLPPAQGVLMLKGPKLDDDGIDNPAFDPQTGNNCGYGINGFGFGDDSVDNECIGMTNFMTFSNGYNGSLNSGSTSEERYGHFSSYWRSGDALRFGGDGYFNFGKSCNFAFPGNSDPCFWGTNGIDPEYISPNGNTAWTEMEESNDSGDRRGLGSMGPFTFEGNTMEEMFVAFVYARSEDESDPYSLNILKESMDSIKYAFTQNTGPRGEKIVFDSIELKKQTESTVDKNIYFYPNPTSKGITFNSSIFKGEIYYEIYNVSGNQIGKGVVENASAGISLLHLRNGMYFIKMKSGEITITKKILKY